MLDKLRNWFKKDETVELHLPENEKFTLKLGDLIVGFLECKDGVWSFVYTDEFKSSKNFNPIPGFSTLDKVYKSPYLWSFFQTRIPGLGQPAVKDILVKENLDKNNEVALLKRFGYKSITNPYTLTYT